MNKDNLKFGLLLGFIAPVLGLITYYIWKFYPTYSIKEFMQVMMAQKVLLTGISSFSLMANAIFFTYYINKHIDKTATGIFIITVIYAISILMLKLFY